MAATALVTGASGGFGTEFALQLAGRGYNLILTARRPERLEQIKAEIAARHPVTVDIIPLDLAAPEASGRLFDATAALGRIVDVLVNNAGFGLHGRFLEIPLERQQEMIDVNVRASMSLAWLFARAMVARGNGHILFVTSVAAAQPSPTYSTYAASKVFLDYLSAALNVELEGSGVSCTTTAPGPSPTGFGEVAGQGPSIMHRIGTLEPATVVQLSLDALFQRKAHIVPGWPNAIMTSLAGYMPRRLVMWSAERLIRDK